MTLILLQVSIQRKIYREMIKSDFSRIVATASFERPTANELRVPLARSLASRSLLSFSREILPYHARSF